MTSDKDLKEIVNRLSPAEKDKLILRLLKKDFDLANRLQFELISGDSVEDRLKQAKQKIENYMNMLKEHIKYSSPGLLMMRMRDTSGYINEHVKITKDKYGEIYLQIFLMIEYLKIYNEYFNGSPAERAYKMNLYIVVRAFKIMVLLKKLPKDLQSDFADDLEEAGLLFGDNAGLMKVAIHHGLDVNWLIRNEIPENIAEIEKNIRQRGYLK